MIRTAGYRYSSINFGKDDRGISDSPDTLGKEGGGGARSKQVTIRQPLNFWTPSYQGTVPEIIQQRRQQRKMYHSIAKFILAVSFNIAFFVFLYFYYFTDLNPKQYNYSTIDGSVQASSSHTINADIQGGPRYLGPLEIQVIKSLDLQNGQNYLRSCSNFESKKVLYSTFCP